MENYISLKEAEKYCRHSQDYLKLRARQGKFGAIKIGRNWVTTREWLEAYNERTRAQRKKSRFLRFKPFILVAGLGLAVFLFLLFINFDYVQEYFQWFGFKTKDFLANVGSLIPSRVVEIK